MPSRLHPAAPWNHRMPNVRYALCALAILSAGCASLAQPDPLEPVNRKIFSLNEGVDQVVLQPAAKAYRTVVPEVAQTGVSNFFSNWQNPWSSVNLMLQGRVGEGMTTLARFGTNTTVGVLGLVDVASGWGMPHRKEDFGLTLDTWGVGTGPYLVMPLFGPSNARDVFASQVDGLGNPKNQISSVSVKNSLTAVQVVSQRAHHLGASELVDQVALDKYLLMRDAHLKKRNRAAQAKDALTQVAMEESSDLRQGGPAARR